MEKAVKTLSVRQLATLFDRSEQTIRRWKDKGINGVLLRSGAGKTEGGSADGGEGRIGSLVFTVEAVRSFVDRNPGLLDKAAPELGLILYGKRRNVLFRKRAVHNEETCNDSEGGNDTEQLKERTAGGGAIQFPEGEYLLCLLQQREREIQEELSLLYRELEQLKKEEAALLNHKFACGESEIESGTQV